MLEWFESIAGPAYAPALMWTALALLVLVVLLLAVRLFRGLTSGTFVSGGRSKARLAVMDATAVDSQRRLVLVRRDDVEHLVLIGGANDLVVERDIGREAAMLRRSATRLHPEPIQRPHAEPVRRPHGEPGPGGQEPRSVPSREPRAPESPREAPLRAEPRMESPPAEPPPRPAPPPPAGPATPEPVQAARPEPRPEPAPEPVAQRPAPAQRPVPEPVRTERPPQPSAPPHAEPRPASAPPSAATAGPAAAAGAASQSGEADFDDVLLQELEQTLEDDAVRPPETDRRAEPDLDAEMDRLLGDLSSERR